MNLEKVILYSLELAKLYHEAGLVTTNMLLNQYKLYRELNKKEE